MKHLPEYKQGYVPSKDLETEERVMDHMAYFLQPFDAERIRSIVDLHSEPKFANKSSKEMQLNLSTSVENREAQGSAEIAAAALTQELDSAEQKVANQYKADNPLRQIYLRTKYQTSKYEFVFTCVVVEN